MIPFVLLPWALAAVTAAKGLAGGGAAWLLTAGALAFIALVVSVLAATLVLVRRSPRR